jgi:hypothetical protein
MTFLAKGLLTSRRRQAALLRHDARCRWLLCGLWLLQGLASLLVIWMLIVP